MKKIEANFDGATFESNPSELLGYGSVIRIDGILKRECYGPMKEHGTNNSSEYKSIIDILDYCEGLEGVEIVIKGDSNLVVKQLSREWRINKGVYKPYALEALSKADVLKKSNKVSFQWIPREENGRADELSKLGLTVDKEVVIKY